MSNPRSRIKPSEIRQAQEFAQNPVTPGILAGYREHMISGAATYATEVECPVCRALRGAPCHGRTGACHSAREALAWAQRDAVGL